MIQARITTKPSRYPVSLAEIRDDLKLGHQEDDAELDAEVAAATIWCEDRQGRAFITRTYTGFLDCWPRDRHRCTVRAVELPRPPALTVTSVSTFDDSDVETTFDPASYFVDTTGLVGRIALRNTASWPCPARRTNGIKIVWTAGYGPDMTDVPENTRKAIRLLVGQWHDDRDAEPSAAVTALLDPDRLWTF